MLYDINEIKLPPPHLYLYFPLKISNGDDVESKWMYDFLKLLQMGSIQYEQKLVKWIPYSIMYGVVRFLELLWIHTQGYIHVEKQRKHFIELDIE